MKKLLLILLAFTTICVNAQTNYSGNSLSVNSYIKLNGFTITGISNDFGPVNKRSYYGITENAAKRYADSLFGLVAGGGGTGTLTSFSFTNTAGITGTVSNAFVAPVLSLSIDTAAIVNFYLKVRAIQTHFDSTYMWAAQLKIKDTVDQHRIQIDALTAAIAARLKYTDTSTMLAAYLSLLSSHTSLINGKQPQLNGTGFVKVSGTTVSYDNSTYLTSFTESDPIYSASSWPGTTNNSSNWNTAFSWGNHASAGYLLSSTATSTYVPYTGATGNVTIGLNGLTAGSITTNSAGITLNSSGGINFTGGFSIQNSDGAGLMRWTAGGGLIHDFSAVTNPAKTVIWTNNSGTIVLNSNTLTLTNKTIAAANNTITGLTNSNLSGTAAISNANLANSSVTINGTAVSLGASATVTAAAGTLTGSTLSSGVTASSLTSFGTNPTIGLLNGTGLPLGTGVTGVLPVANGGTNNSALSVTQGTIYYADGSKLVGLAPGTSGQVLKTNGASANPSWVTISTGGGDALVANPLSQFAATTSAQLAGVILDETGSGSLVFGTSPTISNSLTLSSTTDGFNNASLTTTQMNAISSPADGKQIWNTTEKSIFTYNSDWGWESNDFVWLNKNYLLYKNDFTSTLATPAVTDGMLTYTGTLAANPVNTYNGHPGLVNLSTSTSSTGATSLGTGNGTTTQPILLGGGRLLYEIDVNVPTLSTSGERFSFIAGLSSTNNTNAISDGYVFLYDEGGTINSTAATPNWKTMNGNGSSITANNTGIVVTAGQWYRLSIIVNAANTSASYYIDGSLVVTETLTRPTAAMGIVNRIQKSVGTTARTVTIDYIQVKQRLTTPR